jgi:hypothetical protein
MSHRRLTSVLAHLRRALGRRDAEGLADAELLNRFVQQGDETAFELLVWRHEHMVYGLQWVHSPRTVVMHYNRC